MCDKTCESCDHGIPKYSGLFPHYICDMNKYNKELEEGEITDCQDWYPKIARVKQQWIA